MSFFTLARSIYRRTLRRIKFIDQSGVIQAIKRANPTQSAANHPAHQHIAPPGGRVWLKTYPLSNAELDTLNVLLQQLDIHLPAGELLDYLAPLMTDGDVNLLVALLNFLTGQRTAQPRPSRVIRADELPSALSAASVRLNILFVTGEFPNPVHGGGGRVADFIKVLSRHHNVYVYTVFDPDQDATAYEFLKPYCRNIQAINEYQAFEGHPERIRQFLAHLPDMDIVHYEWPRSLTNYDPAWGKRHLFTYMEAVSLRVWMDLRHRPPLSTDWLRKIVILIRSLKIELVDAAQIEALIAVTEQDANFLATLKSGGDYYVLNHGVDFDQFCLPDHPPEPEALAFVGHFLHYPNEDAMQFFFDKILALIRKQVPGVKVYVVGAEPTAKIRSYHDGRQVIITGTVPDVRPYIQRAAVCIAPLITGAGLRSKVIQYAALRRACVATSVAMIDLNLADGQEVFIADDPNVFADKVVFLLQNPSVAERMAAAAYERVRCNYDTSKLTAQLYNIYTHLGVRQ